MADEGELICAAGALVEGGRGVRFDLPPPARQPSTGFVVRYDGAVHAYANRCPHLGVELDWQPGEFFEGTGLYLVCSTHGALFEPTSGFCIAGPCRGASLEKIPVAEMGERIVLVKK
jgi:nitrite reductase/ring-hydroxylating ferredoxin subunit